MERQNWYLAALGVVRYVPRGSVTAVEAELAPPAEPIVNKAASASEARAALRLVIDEVAPVARAPLDVPNATGSGPQSITTWNRTLVKPSAGKKPSVDREPSASQKLSASEKPLANEEPAASAKLSANKPPSAAEQPSVREKPAPAEDLELRIAVWQPTPDLLFFDSLTPGEQPSAAMARLVANMAAALGRVTEAIEPPQLIDWPSNRGRAGGGLEDARAMVSAFCDARLDASAVQLMLIMGRDAARLLLPEEPDFAAALAQPRSWRDRDTVVTESLAELLGDNAAKRRVWQALVPFVRC